MSWLLTDAGTPDHPLMATLGLAGLLLATYAAIGIAALCGRHEQQRRKRPDWDIDWPLDDWDQQP